MNKPITAMPKYAEYKESGVEWLGEIPAGWEIKALKHGTRIVLGKMLCTTNRGNYSYKPYLKSKNIQWLNVETKSVDYMWFSKAEMYQYRLSTNDLILSEGGEVGKTCIWNDELDECYIQNSAHKVSFSDKNDPKYFLYHMYSYGHIGAFDAMANRVSIAHLTHEKLSNIQCVFPPFPEQTAIAKFLDDKVAKIEALVGIKRRQIELLAERKQILIQNAVTQGLNPDAPMKESGVNWIGEIPAHWEVKRLASFGRFSKGGGFSKSDLADEGTNAVLYGDIYTQYNFVINNAIRTISPKVADKSVWITQGDLLFTGSGETKEDIGKCVLYRGSTKAVAGGDVILFRQTENSPLFLSFCLNANGVVEQKAKLSKGEIIVHTYASKLKGIFIPIPSVVEQEEITEFVWKGIEKINTAITLKQNQIEKLTEYKTTLINAAVTGKIKVVGE